MKVKGFAAILAVFITMFGYAVVDKNYVADTEKQLASYSSQVDYLSKANNDFSKEDSSLRSANADYSRRVSRLEEVSREYASHVCTTALDTTTTTTEVNNPDNPVTGPIAWEDLRIGMEIPVVVDIGYIYMKTDDYSFAISDAKATITEIPSSSYVKYTLTIKLTCTRKSSTYYADNQGFNAFIDYDGKYGCPGQMVGDDYIGTNYGITGDENCIGRWDCCSKYADWTNNTVTYTLTTDGSMYANKLDGVVNRFTIFAYYFS